MDGTQTLVVVLVALLALLVGWVAGAVWARRRAAHDGGDLPALQSRLSSVEAQLAAASAERDLLARQNAALTSLDEQENTVLHALAPVAEKLGAVQRAVALLERDRVEQFGQLAQQLQEARNSDAAILQSAHALTAALANNASRGTWGEVQLRRVVEAAGMLDRVDFAEQVATSGEAGAVRPDLVVSLPGGKQIVVDAKVPLGAYLRAQEHAQDASPAGIAAREKHLAEHAKALRAHVDVLGSKKYWEAVGASPELVVCFLPAESFLAEALRADAGLLDYAFTRNVALASPATLMALLKGVAFGWRQELLTENARELFDLSQQLYGRLSTMGGHVARLGASLKGSVERYNAFIGALESRVLPTARRISALDLGARETLPELPPVETTPRVLSASELLDEQMWRDNGIAPLPGTLGGGSVDLGDDSRDARDGQHGAGHRHSA
ncbi:DNA recombination protein RmuC [Sinomonas sp. R1AF57]|uniref:DNA recombination protein RmuC n=1 Tax=Sinomonas sp. R1AF57 TaxID=2020377 RepID=UPI000B62157C|nr:DNA recombination protein RmuC [Sinomonas sp. R1AF57]ASN52509.1 DNA recombination protein RmuC [Sinomonas sp. R1AF57]